MEMQFLDPILAASGQNRTRGSDFTDLSKVRHLRGRREVLAGQSTSGKQGVRAERVCMMSWTLN